MKLPTPRLMFALGSGFPAGLTAILGNLGVEGLISNLATLIRTMVILFVTAAIVLGVTVVGEPLTWCVTLASAPVTCGALVIAMS